MKKTNFLVLLAGIVLIAAVAAFAAFMPQNRLLPDNAPSVVHSPTPNPAAASSDAVETAPDASDAPINAYLVVTVGGMIYEPLPLAGEGSFTIRQDEQTTNTIHVTPSSVWMEHSTCENQDCVDQGVVSLDNLETRILGNMVICLPNEVVLELYTREMLESTFSTAP